MLTNKEMKDLIKRSASFEEADEVISDAWCRTDSEKAAYVAQLFGLDASHYERLDGKAAYKAALSDALGASGDEKDTEPEEILWDAIRRMAAMSQDERERMFGYPYADIVILSESMSGFMKKASEAGLTER